MLTVTNSLYYADDSAEYNWKLLQRQNSTKVPARIKTPYVTIIDAGMVVSLFSYGILDRITEEPYWSPWYTCWLIATGAWLLKTIIQREQRNKNLSETGIKPVTTIHLKYLKI